MAGKLLFISHSHQESLEAILSLLLNNKAAANEIYVSMNNRNDLFSHSLGGKHATLIYFKPSSIIIWWNQSLLLISSPNYNLLVLHVVIEELVYPTKKSIIQTNN